MALYESSASISSRVHIVYGKNGLFKFEKKQSSPTRTLSGTHLALVDAVARLVILLVKRALPFETRYFPART